MINETRIAKEKVRKKFFLKHELKKKLKEKEKKY